jgi:hypothetical protein
MLSPGGIFAVWVVLLLILARLRFPLPLALISTALLAALLAGFFGPWRHLVEGGFGYFNLILALFAGAFFGQAMRMSRASDALAASVCGAVRGNRWIIGFTAAGLLFLVGMFIGVAGVAVLSAGVFAIPMLRRIGMNGPSIGAFTAIMATCGMIAPPVNVPAMTIADGVNMPFADFSGPLLALSVPPAVFALVYFVLRAQPARSEAVSDSHGPAWLGYLCLAGVLGFWTIMRAWPAVIPDVGAPIVLVAGGLLALPMIPRVKRSDLIRSSFGGVPLELAAVLVGIGVAVQLMALTGVRGWLVMHAMSFPQPWTPLGLFGIPILGGALTSLGTANILGVPFAFAYIHQDMILNVSALSAISALAEFMPPTAISVALASYLVGDATVGQILRRSIVPLLVLTVIALVVLLFATSLAPFLIV